MNVINNLFKKYLNDRNEEYKNISQEISKSILFMNEVIQKNELIELSKYSDEMSDLRLLFSKANDLNNKFILIKGDEIIEFQSLFSKFEKGYNSFESLVDKHNQVYLKEKVQNVREMIGKVEGHDLDNQQIICILKDSYNQNVVAGAGTGKTTTIIGKIKYLLKSEQYKPKEILVLSFTHAAASEMKARLQEETTNNICVSTFHRFGYSVLTSVEGKKPNIFTKSASPILEEELRKQLNDFKYKKRFLRFISRQGIHEQTDLSENIRSIEEYKNYISKYKPITFGKELVKSYGELKIANFLRENGIDYIYEKSYEYDTATEKFAQYKPDFYLTKYNIYIEYFGIDKNGHVPDWFEGDNPTLSYSEGMKWKRKIHKKYGTKLIECYAYEDFEGNLEEKLEKKLKEQNVEFKNIPLEDIFIEKKEYQKIIHSFISTTLTIINLSKNNNINAEELLEKSKENKNAYLLADLILPLRKIYDNYLYETKQIDFADMLIKAEYYINDDLFKNTFKYIIVDEYQDVSSSQYRLLKALRNNNDFKLFCVGDDWQSIYQFNGSDVSYIMDFQEFWGPSEISRIETTYRFSQSLIDISSEFVMKNPKQIRKSLQSKNMDNSLAVTEIKGFNTKFSIKFMVDRMLELPKNCSVYLLGRYTFDADLLNYDSRLSVKYNTSTGTQKVYLENRKDLDIIFYTVHKSKGLQADYVFILNNSSDFLGFPSKVENTPLKNILLEHDDSYENAEERRLFYVALTRAKKHVFLIVTKNRESDFIQELENTYGYSQLNDFYCCPKCGGKLIMFHGKYGDFLGCSNYNLNQCKYTRKINKKA